MFYSTDCNYIVKVIDKDIHYECYTTEQVKKYIRRPEGTLVYKVKSDGKLKLLARINPEV